MPSDDITSIDSQKRPAALVHSVRVRDDDWKQMLDSVSTSWAERQKTGRGPLGSFSSTLTRSFPFKRALKRPQHVKVIGSIHRRCWSGHPLTRDRLAISCIVYIYIYYILWWWWLWLDGCVCVYIYTISTKHHNNNNTNWNMEHGGASIRIVVRIFWWVARCWRAGAFH